MTERGFFTPNAPDGPSMPVELSQGEGVTRLGNVEVLHNAQGLAEAYRLAPQARTLVLHNDPEKIGAQVISDQTETLLPPDDELVPSVSTDAIIAARPDCYYYDTESTSRVPLRTLQVKGENPITSGSIVRGNFGAIAAGPDWGRGSSRELAAQALLGAGVASIYAPSIAPIHFDNLVANGMLPITDREIFQRFMNHEAITIDELAPYLTDFQKRIIQRGGILPFMKAWVEGKEPIAQIETGARPMTIVEKIMASHLDTKYGYVKPEDAGMLQVDRTLCHDRTTAIIDSLIREGLGRSPQVKDPSNHFAFSDHLELMGQGQAGATDEEIVAVKALRDRQREIVQETGINFLQRVICHQYFRENVVVPGRVIVGTDSHTCAAGFANSYAFGVGSSPMAIAWENNVIQANVPETIRVEFTGKFPPSTSGKDIMLFLAHEAQIRSRDKQKVQIAGRVLEYGGPGLETMTADDQWVLANMATECSAKSGIVEPNSVLKKYLMEQRGMTDQEVDQSFVYPDEEAQYADVIRVNLDKIFPSVATPGDTGNLKSLNEVAGTGINTAYSGSCTAGSYEVLLKLAEIFKGKKVVIPTHVQAGSQDVLERARATGLITIFEEAGVTMIEAPGCGACMNAGPGGPAKGEKAISSTNRNFPDRMGKGDVYLANPGVVAATALLGKIPDLEQFLEILENASDLNHLKQVGFNRRQTINLHPDNITTIEPSK